MKLESMTVNQILDLLDAELDTLSESEQCVVAEVVGAVIDFELRHSNDRTEDPRRALGQVMQNFVASGRRRHETH
jgi:hypothetical protein